MLLCLIDERRQGSEDGVIEQKYILETQEERERQIGRKKQELNGEEEMV